MTDVVQAHDLGKRYRNRWALSGCTLGVPAGRVVGLVGPNGAGKSTLLNLMVGMMAPTTGSIKVLGGRPGRDADQLARVGFVAQDTPRACHEFRVSRRRLPVVTRPLSADG